MSKPTVMEKARAVIVLDHAFFAHILLRRPMTIDPGIKTCCINGLTGVIRYNPEFTESLTVKQCVRLLCHEALHYVGMDALRVGGRDKKKWNHIADEWINDFCEVNKVGESIQGQVNRPGASLSTREQLYDMLPEDEDKDNKGKQPPPPGGGPGEEPGEEPAPGNGAGNDPIGGDMEKDAGPPLSDSEKSEQEGKVKQEVAEAAQSAKMRGSLSAALSALVSKIIDTKTPWFDVLERHLSEKMKCDTSWARPNRRYAPDFYMPITEGVGAMGEMVIQVDISGSVSEKEIAYYNGHLKRIVELVSPQKVHLIYTDSEVQKHEVFDKPEDMQITYHRGGGTRMEAGIEFIEKLGIEPACMVTLTDGCDSYDIKSAPDFPVIWCISGKNVPPYGETIHFDMND